MAKFSPQAAIFSPHGEGAFAARAAQVTRAAGFAPLVRFGTPNACCCDNPFVPADSPGRLRWGACRACGAAGGPRKRQGAMRFTRTEIRAAVPAEGGTGVLPALSGNTGETPVPPNRP